MSEQDVLADRFETHRAHLRAVAYRMLGSVAEADDAVQETWLRLTRTGIADVANLGGWLTTVTSRVCLDMLRSRTSRREEPYDVRLPDPVVGPLDRAGDGTGADPEHQALVTDSVGLALLVVLDTLSPAERLAFVLHDMFAVSFDEIAPIADRTPAAARQLASRARRRVQGARGVTDPDRSRQRRVVEAFLAASRAGDFGALLAVLDPDVVLRVDSGGAFAAVPSRAWGAETVAGRAFTFRHYARFARVALVSGAVGVVTIDDDGTVRSVMGFTIAEDRVTAIDILSDTERLARLDVTALAG